MGRRHSLAVIAGLATLLAALPLGAVFDTTTWLFYSALAIAFVVGTAMLVRALRGPAWAQVLAMMGALLLFLTWAFPSGDEFAGLIPTTKTFIHFNSLLVAAGEQARTSAVPVPDLEGLLLLTTAGIGLVAVLVDLAAVGIRRPALAGLPMLAIYSVPVAVLPDGVSLFAFAFAGAGYLWLLVSDSVDRVRRFGRRFSGDGRDVDLWEPSPLSAAGRRLGVVGIIVAVLIPLAIPGMTAGFLNKFGTGTGGDPTGDGGPLGAAATVDMNALLSDNLNRKEEFVMTEVRTNDPNPYYLRLGVGEQLTPEGFKSVLPSGGGTQVTRSLPGYEPPAGAGVSVGRYRAEVNIVNLDIQLAPVYPPITALSGLDGSWFLDGGTDQVYSRRPSINGKQYAFDYVRMNFTAAALRSATPITGPDAAGNRVLTNHPEHQFVADLVDQLTAGKTNQYDRVRALYDYFDSDNGFGYSLSTVEGDSGSAIVDFLTNKRGFCVQYAAALGWLVREAGYPSRVAFGWTRGGGPRNGLYSLTNLNLHAWTEVYFQGFGWVPFDATPAASVLGSARTAWAPDTNAPATEEPTAGPSPGSSVGGGPSVAPSGRDPNDPGEAPIASDPVSSTNPWLIAGAVAAVIMLIALFSPGARRRALRRNRQARGGKPIVLTGPPPGHPDIIADPAAADGARRDAHAAWSELLDTMIDFGVDVDVSETPRGTSSRLQTVPELAPTGRGKTAVLARAEERARYAPIPLRSDNLDEAVKSIRAAFAERASRGQRIMAWLFPRSVLLRWRMGWYTFYSGMVVRAGTVRDNLLRPSPRRLFSRRDRT
jgi:transglutaminase-like putative cysteine protease